MIPLPKLRLAPRLLGAALATTLMLCIGSGAAAQSGRGQPTAGPEGYARQLLALINEYRRASGLSDLAPAGELSAIALEHSVRMSNERRLSHAGFRDRFARTTSAVCVENVGWNFARPDGQLQGWRRSPSHDRNLLDPEIRYAGIGVTGPFVTFFACS